MTLRDTNLERLSNADLDVLVVGGGINGAVSSAVLAARGAKVGLVDRGDFGGFTSENSSNLVWGGIKYLENYEFGLVRKLCSGRNRLIHAYPSNVKEIRFLVSVGHESRHAPWFIAAGTAAYWGIGSFRTTPPRLLSPKSLSDREAMINTSSVRGGVEYSDAYLPDNDSRFVFSFVRSALNSGAFAANYVALREAEWDGRRWIARLLDKMTGAEIEVTAGTMINAAGPFADHLNSEQGVATTHRLVLSKGVHLVVPRIGRGDKVLAFFDDTGRLFFVIPMGHRSVIGTTDTRVAEPETFVTEEDRRFLLDQVNARLSLQQPLTVSDIISERCGVRPLVVANGADSTDEDWTALSREHVIERNNDRHHLTIFGGKLTDCLNVGREVFDNCQVLGVPLTSFKHDWYGEPRRSVQKEYRRQAGLMGIDRLSQPTVGTLSERLWRRYGLRAFTMLEAIQHDPQMAEPVIASADYLRCELELAARTEMVTRFDDFLRRRSKIAMVVPRDELIASEGLHEAAHLLFGPDARTRFNEEFGDDQVLGDRRRR